MLTRNNTNTDINTIGMMSDAKFYEGYSRYNDDLKRYETWHEAVDRVMDMHVKFYTDKGVMTPDLMNEINFAKTAYKNKKILGAQRALQFGGEQLLRHQMRLYNCVSSYADRPVFFGEFFYVLLCGAGAGFSVQKHHIAKLPQIMPRTKQPKTHVVEDSIEGWATALDVLMSSYFIGGGKHPEYEGRKIYFDLNNIRPKGALISGGFKAPGPEPLRLALDKIEYILQGIALHNPKGSNLRSIHVYDICMFAANAVLSGGVRRSATICLFSPDDDEMANAKTGDWFVNNKQRSRSNNSAVIVRKTADRDQFHNLMQSIRQFGEPGFVFVESTEHTYNPCVEIGKYPVYIHEDGTKESGWQGCNLVELNGGSFEDEEDFYASCRAGAILGTLQAGYTDFKFVSDITKKIFDREALLGVSITGWMANPDLLFNEQRLKTGAQLILSENKRIAKMIAINPAARATCVKPSGNSSVILKTPSGIHGEHAKRSIRNVQMNKGTEVAQLIKASNPYMIEESVWSEDRSDYVISFPIIAKEGSIFKNQLYGVKLLEKVKLVQQSWIEFGTDESLCVDPTVRHNVSNTIEVDDWDAVEEYIFTNRQYFAGISLMAVSGEKAYVQAPNTTVYDEKEIVDMYGTGAIFASGLVVEGLKAFNNDLWLACSTAFGYGEDIASDDAINLLKKDWVRRFVKYAQNYFEDDMAKAEYCLKDVYNLHKWEKIQQNVVPINWIDELKEKKYIDVDTTGAAACSPGVGGVEGCLI